MAAREEEFQRLINSMRQLLKDGDVAKALAEAKKADTIRHSDKLKQRIAKMEEYLLEMEEFSEGEDVDEICDGFFISKQLSDQLYPYQKAGVSWFYSLYKMKKGGILADDMGLGKTLQTIAFLSGLFDASLIKHALIVVPSTLVLNWLNEFKKWSPLINVDEFKGEARIRERTLLNVQRTSGVLVTTYGLILTSANVLSHFRGREFVWDYIILDEGHKIKNQTKGRTALNDISGRNRIILTGTPIQNNLMELWSLYDYVHHGSLLGTRQTFKMEFETPIIRSREKNSSVNEKAVGEKMARILMERIGPYLLRRTKAEVFSKNAEHDNPTKLMSKNDLVVWITLSETQISIYEEFLSSSRVKEILMSNRSPLVELTILKKLCDHPRLLSAAACSQLGLNDSNNEDPDEHLNIARLSDDVLIRESGKLKFLLQLMNNLRNEKHRVLIFSQSRKMLDIIQRVLKNKQFRILRLDGTITKQVDRQRIIERFETDLSYDVLLLTVQIGGVGLNLTSADRVVIFDPSWNPATDSQAVDRAYRIGQTKPVIVYRLITCAGVEEKIYRRQVFKASIHKETAGGSKNTYRYFTSFELKDMFTLDDPTESKTQQQLEQLHVDQRKTYPELDEHIAFLHSLDMYGISDNDLLFTLNEAVEDIGAEEKYHIASKVDRATKLLEMECELTKRAQLQQGQFKTPKLPTELPKSVTKPKKVQDQAQGDYKAVDNKALSYIEETLSTLRINNEKATSSKMPEKKSPSTPTPLPRTFKSSQDLPSPIQHFSEDLEESEKRNTEAFVEEKDYSKESDDDDKNTSSTLRINNEKATSSKMPEKKSPSTPAPLPSTFKSSQDLPSPIKHFSEELEENEKRNTEAFVEENDYSKESDDDKKNVSYENLDTYHLDSRLSNVTLRRSSFKKSSTINPAIESSALEGEKDDGNVYFSFNEASTSKIEAFGDALSNVKSSPSDLPEITVEEVLNSSTDSIESLPSVSSDTLNSTQSSSSGLCSNTSNSMQSSDEASCIEVNETVLSHSSEGAMRNSTLDSSNVSDDSFSVASHNRRKSLLQRIRIESDNDSD